MEKYSGSKQAQSFEGNYFSELNNSFFVCTEFNYQEKQLISEDK